MWKALAADYLLSVCPTVAVRGAVSTPGQAGQAAAWEQGAWSSSLEVVSVVRQAHHSIVEGTWPRVSVVTPSYNQGPFLEQTLLSVVEQGYPNLEYIVMDGGSTDQSVEIIRRYADRLAYWVSAPDDGQTAAINKGFGIATGDIVTWLNADDVLFPGGVQAAAECFVAHPEADFVYGDSALLAPDGSIALSQQCIAFDRKVLLYGRSLISQPASFIRRAAWLRLGPLDERYDFCMDLEYWVRAVAHDVRFKTVRQPIAGSRLHSQTKTSTQRAKLDWQHRRILNQYGLLPFRNVPFLNLWLYRLLLLRYKTKAVIKRGITRGQFHVGAASRLRRRHGM